MKKRLYGNVNDLVLVQRGSMGDLWGLRLWYKKDGCWCSRYCSGVFLYYTKREIFKQLKGAIDLLVNGLE